VAEILALVTDLFFQARVSAAARAAGHTVLFVASVDKLPADTRATLALVDLDASLDVPTAIRRLKTNGCNVIAFGPHMDAHSRRAARTAGADRVLAKSKFVIELPRIMSSATLNHSDQPDGV
jgi:CheY-like chemotaxis protein